MGSKQPLIKVINLSHSLQPQWRQFIYAVSLLMASALVYALQTPFSAPIKSPFVDIYQWKLTGLPITVSLCLSLLPVTISLCLSMSKHYFYPY